MRLELELKRRSGNVGPDISRIGFRFLCFGVLVREFLRAGLKGTEMNLEYVISGFVALGLLAYLLYALLKPEKF